MRNPLIIIGVILLVIGGLISAGVFHMTSEKQVAKLGPLEITSTEEKRPPLNLGYILLGIAWTDKLMTGAASKREHVHAH